jgi:hypothetical protein
MYVDLDSRYQCNALRMSWPIHEVRKARYGQKRRLTFGCQIDIWVLVYCGKRQERTMDIAEQVQQWPEKVQNQSTIT